MNGSDRDSKQNSNGGEKRSHNSSETRPEDDTDQAAKRQNTGGDAYNFKVAANIETDQHKLEMRLKQVQYGKNTIGYDNYTAAVPLNKRGYNLAENPRTPDPYEIQSKRAFEGRIKVWRRGLHTWDAKEKAQGDNNENKLSNKTEGNNASSSSEKQKGKESHDEKGKVNGNMKGSNSRSEGNNGLVRESSDIGNNKTNSVKSTEESSVSSTAKSETKITKRVGDTYEEGEEEVIETGFYVDRSPSKMSAALERNTNRIENINTNENDEGVILENKIEDNDAPIPIINEDSIQSFDYENNMLNQNFGTDIKEAPPCEEAFEEDDDDEDVL
eukprot:CAMPEP_0119035340 /NCGR_PEP_ID=MMETSP1177-20130426/2264_1 /TAXON_ID=2985 /ORGANISM="Ochromonas sp, Strain CCMP1899" /LENGTH=328 /DNA_ID=CAMNT_0006993403 /DNA_START=150 /DNA_END=1136 /DNA_ORIENTATION=+